MIYTCTFQEHFRFVPFHTCYGNSGIDGAGDSQVDGDATLVDADRHKTKQKEKLGQGCMNVYAAEDVLLFSGAWRAKSCFSVFLYLLSQITFYLQKRWLILNCKQVAN